ncbi:DUF397 domain-containing protein [Streptomyces bottropensis]|uniref:DUF397 domain-containing protein n=1 Tax=Streptomyces sp. SID5476 TaxID=2690302 RepID=UPI00314510CF
MEITNRHTHIAIRDSKAPAGAVLSFPTGAFTTFIEALKLTPLRRTSPVSEADPPRSSQARSARVAGCGRSQATRTAWWRAPAGFASASC